MHEENGFTLTELLILLAIILTIAAIALPNLLHSRIAADESSAINSIRNINKAEVSYQVAHPIEGYANALGMLGPSGPTSLDKPTRREIDQLDSGLSNAISPARPYNGYWFLVTPTGKDASGVVTGYVVGGSASAFNKTGIRDFCSTEDGIVHFRVPDGQSQPITSASDCAALPILH